MLKIKEMSVNIQGLLCARILCWVLYMDSHLIVHPGGWDHFTGGRAVTEVRDLSQEHIAPLWQRQDSELTPWDQ